METQTVGNGLASDERIEIASAEAVARRPERVRLDFVDGLRGLSALFVLVCHAFYEPSNGYYASRFMSHLGLTYGIIAVVVFLVLSGFCLMLPVARRGDSLGSLKTFFRRRARRILPPYYAALLLSVVFILMIASEKTGTAWDNALPLTWRAFWAHLFLVHNLMPGVFPGRINYPLWSIAVEFQVYLFMPLLVWSLRRFGNTVTLAWAIPLGIVIHVGSAWFLGLFALGCVAARLCVQNQGQFGRSWRISAYALWAAIAVILVCKGKAFLAAYAPYFDTIIGAAAALLICVTYADLSQRAHRLTRFLSWPPLVAVGLFSYSLYLVHAPLLHAGYLLFSTFGAPRTGVMFLLLLACAPLIVGAAYLFFLVFEKPFLNAPSSSSQNVPLRIVNESPR